MSENIPNLPLLKVPNGSVLRETACTLNVHQLVQLLYRLFCQRLRSWNMLRYNDALHCMLSTSWSWLVTKMFEFDKE